MQVIDLLKSAGLPCDSDPSPGARSRRMGAPATYVPRAGTRCPLSIQHTLDPASHFALGEAVPGSREKGVLILGSGGAVHPLGNPYASLGPGAPTDDWAREFNTWLTDAITGETAIALSTTARSPRSQSRLTRTLIITCLFLWLSVQRDRVLGELSFTGLGPR